MEEFNLYFFFPLLFLAGSTNFLTRLRTSRLFRFGYLFDGFKSWTFASKPMHKMSLHFPCPAKRPKLSTETAIDLALSKDNASWNILFKNSHVVLTATLSISNKGRSHNPAFEPTWPQQKRKKPPLNLLPKRRKKKKNWFEIFCSLIYGRAKRICSWRTSWKCWSHGSRHTHTWIDFRLVFYFYFLPLIYIILFVPPFALSGQGLAHFYTTPLHF